MKEKKFLLILLFAVLLACGSNENGSRPFYMGFTPWLYAATLEARQNVYDFINTEGDIIAHHFQQGLPYTASNVADFNTYSQSIKDEINDRIALTERDKTIYVSVDILNTDRDDLADLWDTTYNMPRPSPWDSRSFDSAEVIDVYINFSKVIIEKFRSDYGALPKYFNYGVEISDLMIKNPTGYTKFVTFAETVYTTLKSSYPSIKFMISIAMKSPNSTDMNTVKEKFALLKDYVDVVGISTYGYAFFSHADKGNPDNLPADWLTQIQTIAPNKPYAITETGWIAEDLNIPAYNLNVTSNETYQDNYLKKLFNDASAIDAEFIIWFTAFDYDTLWSETLGGDDLTKIWKDTGLIDETLHPRKSLNTWREWALRTKRE